VPACTNPVSELLGTGTQGDSLSGPVLLRVSSFAATQKAAIATSINGLVQLTSNFSFSEVSTIVLNAINVYCLYLPIDWHLVRGGSVCPSWRWLRAHCGLFPESLQHALAFLPTSYSRSSGLCSGCHFNPIAPTHLTQIGLDSCSLPTTSLGFHQTMTILRRP
jgi:hypothetical protein